LRLLAAFLVVLARGLGRGVDMFVGLGLVVDGQLEGLFELLLDVEVLAGL